MARILRGVLLVGVGLLACLPPRPPDIRAQSMPLRLVRSTPESVVLEFTLPGVHLEQVSLRGESYTRIRVDGLTVGGVPGAPQLPRLGTMIGIPAAGEVSLRFLDVEETQVSLAHPVYSEPVPVLDRRIAEGSPGGRERLADGWTYEFAPDPVIYGQDAFYPARVVELGEPGWVRDRRVVRVGVNPVRYNPQQAVLVLAQRLVVEIVFEDGARTTSLQVLDVPSPIFEELLSDVLLNYDLARDWRSGRVQVGAVAKGRGESSLATQPGSYKVVVDTDGLHRLTYAGLRAAGIPVDSLDPRTLQLYEGDREVSITVIGEQDGSLDPGDVLLFYGHRPRTRYVDRNVYWLRFGERTGLRMATRSLVSASAPFKPTWTTARYAESPYYDPLFAGADGDHWYATDVRPGAPKTLSLVLMAPSPDAPTATLRLQLVGYTHSSTVNPDHHLAVQVNGRAVGDLWWDGKGAVGKSKVLDGAILRAGENTVTLEAPGDTGAPVEGVWLDALELDYALGAVVGDEAHVILQPGVQSYELGGWSVQDVRGYDITEPRHPIQLTGAAVTGSGGGYALAFADVVLRPVSYYFVAEARGHLPSALIADQPSDLRSATNGADYVIIGHASLLGAIQHLVAHRRAQGLRVAVVDVQDVYDEFSGGLMEPEAIRSFIGYALQHWTAPAPTYVLLVGDGHYDFLDHYGYGAVNLIPPYLGMVDPWWGETAADNRYAAVVGEDVLPDVMLGRLPVSNPTEAAVVAGKIVSYELRPLPGDWNARHVFVADDNDYSGDFDPPLEAVYKGLSSPWVGQRIYLDEQPVEAARQETLAAWQRGALMVSYMGHGSWHQWAAESLFDIHGVPTLRNERQWPIVLSMTCLTGFFHHPEYGTLDELLVRLNGGGAVATWSPSGLGVQSGHEQLYRTFYRSVLEEANGQLGSAVLAAKLDFYANVRGHDELLDTYHLFGDPAMVLNLTIRPWPETIYLPVLYRNSMGG